MYIYWQTIPCMPANNEDVSPAFIIFYFRQEFQWHGGFYSSSSTAAVCWKYHTRRRVSVSTRTALLCYEL